MPFPARAATSRTAAAALLALVPFLAIAGCGPSGAEPAGGDSAQTQVRQVVLADGSEREYRLVVPSTGSPESPKGRPLVIGLHGGMGNAEQFEQSSGFGDLAQREGFVAAFPEGSGLLQTWNAGGCCGAAAREGVDDVGFIRTLIAAVESVVPIDPRRVFVAGHSNGGMMAYRLACELSDEVVGIGVQSAAFVAPSCPDGRPVSVIHLHGTADENVPISGGRGNRGLADVDYPPARAAAEALARRAKCAGEPRTSTDPDNQDITVTRWSPCSSGSEVRFVTVRGASHAWMGTPAGSPRLTGEAYLKLDAAREMWDFFASHPRR